MDEEKKDLSVDGQEAEIESEEETETEEEVKDKKIKNLISAVILLAGLFVGSLFVDVAQMIRGGGFSQKALSSTDVFSSAGKTWVAYTEPIVKVQVISDDTCEACKPDEVLVGLKQALPTISNEKIDANSLQGQKLIAQFGIKTIPAFIFSKEIEKTDLFAKAEPFLDKQGDFYAIKSAEAGFPIGKYITTPEISAGDIKLGSDDAVVKVVAFGNFQSPTDKKYYQAVITPMLKDYADKIQFVFKNYVPATATQATSAALAASCANDQGKFLPFADKLFATQDSWSKVKDATAMLKGYAATLGLNTGDFNKCLDDKKYQDQTTANLALGQSFGLAATPSTFVGNELFSASDNYDTVKKAIDGQLNK
ncbi:MAG: thioredoxin domain-containing protein [Candidatus Moranbacteria bacterium]|nr:thioredoxin domain-containing protein [Candidatus Moranbacteria bacterium]